VKDEKPSGPVKGSMEVTELTGVTELTVVRLVTVAMELTVV
jgi:hypothetical protein